jgi:hypothetical protein
MWPSRFRPAVLLAILCFGAIPAIPTAASEQQCQPGIDSEWERHRPDYDLLWTTLTPHIDDLTALVNVTVANAAAYSNLLGAARSIAASIPNGRLVVTLPDGTVVLDTSRADGETPANANSYPHFLAKTINENHNTRLAIMAAQMYACGIGIETKVSTTTGRLESYFAVRLGMAFHLSSSGTARLSVPTRPGPFDY